MSNRKFQEFADAAEIIRILVNGPITLPNQLITRQYLDDNGANINQVAQNKTDIAVNKANITSNTSNISANDIQITANKIDILRNVADIADNLIKILQNTSASHANTLGVAANKKCCELITHRVDNLTLDQITDVFAATPTDFQQLTFIGGQWRAMTPHGYLDGIVWTPGMVFAHNTIYQHHLQQPGEHIDVHLALPLTQHVDGTTQHMRLTVTDPSLITWSPDFTVDQQLLGDHSYLLDFRYQGGHAWVTVNRAVTGFGRGGFGSQGFGTTTI